MLRTLFTHPSRFMQAMAGIALLTLSFPDRALSADRHVVSGASVAIYDLVGKVVAEPGSGADVVVEVTPVGADAAKLSVEQGEIGRWQTLRVVFPGNRVTYRGEDFWGTDIHVGDDGRFGDRSLVGDEGDRRKVTISGRGSGLEAHADLHVLVPKGKTLALFLGVGSLSITNVDGDLKVDVASASATVRGTRGSLAIDAGSGEIQVSDASGEVSLDTGSGSTTVRGVRGGRLSLDTGSGDITVIDATVDVLKADTGSGGVEIQDLDAQDIALDTGSGSVRMGLLPGSPRSIVIDCGSGGVTLAVPKDLDASFECEAGSGGIDIRVPHQVTERSHDHVNGRFGTGKGRIHIESGSGGVRIVPGTGSQGKKSSQGKS